MVTTRKRPSRKSKVVLSIVLLMKNVTGRLFVRNLAYTTNEEELVSLFGQYGEVVQRSFHEPETREGGGSARKRSLAAICKHGILVRLYGGQDMGSPDVSFLDPEAEDVAERLALGERHVLSETKRSLAQQGVKPCGDAGGDHALLVKNLPFSTTEAEERLELPPTKEFSSSSCSLLIALSSSEAAKPSSSLAYRKFKGTSPQDLLSEKKDGGVVAKQLEGGQLVANDEATASTREVKRRTKACKVTSLASFHAHSIGWSHWKFEELRLAVSPSVIPNVSRVSNIASLVRRFSPVRFTLGELVFELRQAVYMVDAMWNYDWMMVLMLFILL
ncbi:hypothetical protein SELMODRAFT_418785 [Selaginella moellendorffii]|uniref:RRM domain-containing protein n=1 Tax=Selaginella moellendorffii TaxID=88036 RepID=D8S6D6_SELML|nr:hypothetical protein SELMODRAFT_418785 [Selaginella moellendorffii]